MGRRATLRASSSLSLCACTQWFQSLGGSGRGDPKHPSGSREDQADKGFQKRPLRSSQGTHTCELLQKRVLDPITAKSPAGSSDLSRPPRTTLQSSNRCRPGHRATPTSCQDVRQMFAQQIAARYLENTEKHLRSSHPYPKVDPPASNNRDE